MQFLSTFGLRTRANIGHREGTVKRFNPTKGYGFIKPEAGGADVFVHISAVEKAGYTNLAGGARISYELVTGRSGKSSAENLRLG